MAAPSQPQGDYEELSQLALRITKHLQQHPHDSQAQADLKYVTSQIPRDVVAGPEAHPGMKVAAGLMQAGLDIPKGIISSILHPIQTAGQITGIGNAAAADKVLHDPEASLAEKADAVLRATPFNMGYAAERGLLNATGAKSDEPASLTDQAHAAGNVASLALLGVKPSAPLRLMRGGLARIVGPVLDRLGTKPVPIAAPIPAAPVPEMLPNGLLASDVQATLAKQGFQGAALDRAMAVARRAPQPQGLLSPTSSGPAIGPPSLRMTTPDPLDIPTFQRGRPGHPLWQGEGSPTTSAQVRGGEPLLPSANPAVLARLQATPTRQLLATLRTPETPQVIKDLIFAELAQRKIVGQGLLAPQ